jgi:predicted ATPase
MITRLQVRNFKSLRKIDMQFGAINVLVGPNMAGKSNVLDVFRFLHEVVFPKSGNEGVSFAVALRGGVNEVLWKGGDEKLIGIVVDATDPTQADTRFKYALEIIAGAGGYVSTKNESLKLIRSAAEYDLVAVRQGYPWLKNVDGKEVGGTGTPSMSALQNASPAWDGYRFYEMIKLWRFYHLFPSKMKEPSKMASGQILDEPGGDNLSAWLLWLQTHSPEAFARLNEVLRDLVPGVTQVRTIPTEDGNVHLSIRENGLKSPTSVWQASDGFLALTALLSLIYVPLERSGTLYCVEEPENYLHPRLLETLIELLRQTLVQTRDSVGSKAQFVFTTQSPYFLDQFSLEEIIWIEKKDGETRAYRPADKAHLRKMAEDKELGLGDLMYTGALGEGK